MIKFIAGIVVTLIFEEAVWRLGKSQREGVMVVDPNSPLGQIWKDDWDWDTNTAADKTAGLRTTIS